MSIQTKKTKSEAQVDKIKELLSEKDFSGAESLLQGYIQEDLSQEEKGEIYTQLILLYIDTVNETNDVYRKSLELALEATKKLHTEEVKAEDKLKSLVVKQRLQEIDDLD